MRFVLDVFAQILKSVDFAGEPRGERGAGRIARFGDFARRSRRVAGDDRFQAEAADDLPALAERMNMAVHGTQVRFAGALYAEQLEMNRQECLADDVQAGGGQQIVDVGDAAGDRILDRNHAKIGRAVLDRREGVLECRARQRIHFGKAFDAGDMRIGARFALIGD